SPQKPSSDDDPERTTTESTLRQALGRLTRKTCDDTRAARLLGISVKTLRRWIERLAAGHPLILRRGGVMHPGPAESEERVRETVRELHGLPGAESLARSVSGVSRRRAAAIKREVVTAMERTRKAECARVEISEPGVVR